MRNCEPNCDTDILRRERDYEEMVHDIETGDAWVESFWEDEPNEPTGNH